LIVYRTQCIACAGLTAIGVVLIKVPKAVLAGVTAAALHVGLAVTTARLQVAALICVRVTDPSIQRATRVTVTRLADFGIREVSARIPVEELFALFTVTTHGVVHTVVTDTSTDTTRQLKHSSVKVATGRMVVTITTSARIGLLAGWFPRQVIVEILARFAVETLGVVGTFTLAVNHVGLGLHPLLRQTARGVAVARTRPSHHHLIDSIVIFLLNFFSVVQQIVSQSVKFGEVDSQVGHLEQILNLLRVEVVVEMLKVGCQHSHYDLSFGRRSDRGIS